MNDFKQEYENIINLCYKQELIQKKDLPEDERKPISLSQCISGILLFIVLFSMFWFGTYAVLYIIRDSFDLYSKLSFQFEVYIYFVVIFAFTLLMIAVYFYDNDDNRACFEHEVKNYFYDEGLLSEKEHSEKFINICKSTLSFGDALNYKYENDERVILLDDKDITAELKECNNIIEQLKYIDNSLIKY